MQTISRVNPDWLLVLGDEKSMATALVGAYMNIPVARIAGGDRVIGNVDDQVRHGNKLVHALYTTQRALSAFYFWVSSRFACTMLVILG